MSSAAEGAASPEAVGGDGDPLPAELLATLRQHLGQSILATETTAGELLVRVERGAWLKTAETLRHVMGMDYFCFLSGIDWMVNPDLSGEKVWDPEGGASLEGAEGFEADDSDEGVEDEAAAGLKTGLAGGDSRFQLLARVYSTSQKAGVTLKADLDEAEPRAASWVGVYRGADWHERETWEMYGFVFDGHPGLRHMYLPGEFEGHPLRKDFPLLAREVKPWPGLVDVEAMPGEEAAPDAAAAEGSDA